MASAAAVAMDTEHSVMAAEAAVALVASGPGGGGGGGTEKPWHKMEEDEGQQTQPWHKRVRLPGEVLSASPSSLHDVDWATESRHRAWGCELIQEAGILLRLPQVVMCTGQTLLQRFYYRKSLTKYDAFSVAMGALLQAAKLEEALVHIRVRDVIHVFHRMYLRRRELPVDFLEIGGEPYNMFKEVVSVAVMMITSAASLV
jgi:Cyclin, N-terminal domain